MDELELLLEFQDRHKDFLIYEGSYHLPTPAELLERLFVDWRQRVYRFENNLGASVVFYQPLTKPVMTWDVVLAKFFGDDPFDFKYGSGVRSNVRWRDVQQFLDHIKGEGN
ncbi:MAG: hypothetical protein ACRCYY_12480 [Trueperaceae bacterium]